MWTWASSTLTIIAFYMLQKCQLHFQIIQFTVIDKQVGSTQMELGDYWSDVPKLQKSIKGTDDLKRPIHNLVTINPIEVVTTQVFREKCEKSGCDVDPLYLGIKLVKLTRILAYIHKPIFLFAFCIVLKAQQLIQSLMLTNIRQKSIRWVKIKLTLHLMRTSNK